MTPDQVRQLVSGYATNTLSEQERERLFALALEDQELFDELMREQPLVELLANPDARDELLEALSPQLAGSVRARNAAPAMAAAPAPAPIVEMPAPRRSAPRWWMAAAACAGFLLIGVAVYRSYDKPSPDVAQTHAEPPAVSAPAGSVPPDAADSAATKPESPKPTPPAKPELLAKQPPAEQKPFVPEEPLDTAKKRKNEANAEAERLSGTVAVNSPPPAPPPPPARQMVEAENRLRAEARQDEKAMAKSAAPAVGASSYPRFGNGPSDEGNLAERSRLAAGPTLTARLFLASGQPLAPNATVPAGTQVQIILDSTAPIVVRINNGAEIAFGPSTIDRTITVDRTMTIALDARLANSALAGAARDQAPAPSRRAFTGADRVILPLDAQPVHYQWTLQVSN